MLQHSPCQSAGIRRSPLISGLTGARMAHENLAVRIDLGGLAACEPMTPRPGRIARIVEVDVPRPRSVRVDGGRGEGRSLRGRGSRAALRTGFCMTTVAPEAPPTRQVRSLALGLAPLVTIGILLVAWR